jgi:membrane-associated HD superfamily phosphohydrolase
MLVPILVVISYLFDFHLYTSTNTIILIASIILLVFFVIGLVYLLITRSHYERKLKASYQREMTIIITISAIGVLGLGIMYMYFGGPIYYVPHVITPTGIIMYFILYFVGVRYFNISLLKRR